MIVSTGKQIPLPAMRLRGLGALSWEPAGVPNAQRQAERYQEALRSGFNSNQALIYMMGGWFSDVTRNNNQPFYDPDYAYERIGFYATESGAGPPPTIEQVAAGVANAGPGATAPIPTTPIQTVAPGPGVVAPVIVAAPVTTGGGVVPISAPVSTPAPAPVTGTPQPIQVSIELPPGFGQPPAAAPAAAAPFLTTPTGQLVALGFGALLLVVVLGGRR